MEKEVKKLTARCKYCGKEVFSLYRGQLDYNIQAHEISCPERIKGELDAVKNQREASNDFNIPDRVWKGDKSQR